MQVAASMAFLKLAIICERAKFGGVRVPEAKRLKEL